MYQRACPRLSRFKFGSTDWESPCSSNLPASIHSLGGRAHPRKGTSNCPYLTGSNKRNANEQSRKYVQTNGMADGAAAGSVTGRMRWCW